MPFEAAKCPTCGAAVQVQSDVPFAFCSSCGNRLETKKAIALVKLDVSEAIPVKGISSVENDLIRGRQCLDVKDWSTAFKVFSEAVAKDATSFEAWYGCLAARSENFQATNIVFENDLGVMSLTSITKNSMTYAEDTQRANLYAQLSSWDAMLEAVENAETENRNRQKQFRTEGRKNSKTAILTYFLGFPIVLGIAGLFVLIFGGSSTSIAPLLALPFVITTLVVFIRAIVKSVRSHKSATKITNRLSDEQVTALVQYRKVIMFYCS